MSATHILTSTDQNPHTVRDIQRLLDNEAEGPNGAIIEVHDGDTIKLMGKFTQGDAEYLRLSKSVTLQGHGVGATIFGGCQLQWGAIPDPNDPSTNIPKPITATIDSITFENFNLGAIWFRGTTGNTVISNCHFENYRYGEKPGKKGAWPIVGGSASVSGYLTITNCHFGPPPFKVDGMNNLIHINNCPLDQLTIIHNRIEDMSFMGIAVFGVMGRTTIADNHITIGDNHWTSLPHTSAGISFGLRLGSYTMERDGSVVIERNTVTINCPDSNGIAVGLYSEEGQYLPCAASGTAREVTIRDNVVHMNDAGNRRAALACLGACSHSTWSNNVVTGSAPYGIVVSQETWEKVQEGQKLSVVASTAPPIDNTFLNNQFAGGDLLDPTAPETKKRTLFDEFTASEEQIFIDHTARDVKLFGNVTGPVSVPA